MLRRCLIILLFLWAGNAAHGAPTASLELWESGFGVKKTIPLMQRFYDETGILVRLSSVEGGELPMRLRVAQQINKVPNLAIFPSDQLMYDRWLHLPTIPESFATQIPANRLDEKRKSVVVSGGHGLLLYYNKSLVSQVPNSWEDLLASLAASRQSLVTALTVPYFSNPFWQHFGLLDEDFRIGSDSARALVRVLAYMKSLLRDCYIHPSCLGSNCVAERFLVGAAPYALDGTWAYDSMRNALGDQLGVAEIPAFAGRVIHPIRIPYVMAMPKVPDAEHLAEIMTLWEFFQSPANQVSFFSQFGLPLADGSVVMNPAYDVAARQTLVSPSGEYIGCLFHVMAYYWEPFLNDALSEAELFAGLSLHLRPQTCEIPRE